VDWTEGGLWVAPTEGKKEGMMAEAQLEDQGIEPKVGPIVQVAKVLAVIQADLLQRRLALGHLKPHPLLEQAIHSLLRAQNLREQFQTHRLLRLKTQMPFF